MTERGAMADLAERAKQLCFEYGWSRCPVCGTDHAVSEQNSSLADCINAAIKTLTEQRRQDAYYYDDYYFHYGFYYGHPWHRWWW